MCLAEAISTTKHYDYITLLRWLADIKVSVDFGQPDVTGQNRQYEYNGDDAQ